ncbi:uncharacterized protein AC631_01913 [Debaryomyces fabryi]|uniref:candidapepsin n=1 Tax=Debaryomyces fabryi TaxID=58627 RepID=A0A0V1Q1K9_9ASCO|nr:uncharacterized protein AC631_01913 [Debaryomyces fabryi]KSA02355.1 hypothetical protein AC631_01913 [Debaryomyces fabryi]CUM51566.1 unnamed protein product [Debaryomyces fabryi]
MKVATFLGPIALAAIAVGENPNVFKIDFNVLRGNSKRDLSLIDERPYVVKRDGSAEMEIQNERTFYLANLKVGSNEDEVGVLVDTGSSDLWMMSHDLTCEAVSSSSSKRDVIVDSKLPTTDNDNKGGKDKVVDNKDQAHAKQVSKSSEDVATKSSDGNDKALWDFGDTTTTITTSPESPGSGGGGSGSSGSSKSADGSTTNTCTSYGSFKTEGSDTFNRNSSAPAFSISYADGTDAYGIWGTDDVRFGDITVKDLSFAIANETSSNVGVLGIGLSGLETTYSSQYGGNYQYENLPLKLKSQGTIEKAAYSVYLGEKAAKAGSILFGAVDSAKYTGDLQTVQIVNTMKSYGYSEAIKLEIIVNGLTFNDSGSEIDITSNEHTAVLDTGSTYSYFPTSLLRSVGETLNGQYSSSLGAYMIDCIGDDDDSYYFTIDFSGAKIQVPLSDLVTEYSTDQCFLSILPQTGADYILFGDNVLRSAYLVYDLEDFEISLAQVKYTSDESISSISSSVPNAKNAPGYSSTAISTASDDSNSVTTSSFGSKKSDASVNNLSTVKWYSLILGFGLLVGAFI